MASSAPAKSRQPPRRTCIFQANADTNFLTRCYLPIQARPPAADQLARLHGAGGWLPILWLHRLELANAFEQHVFAGRTLGQPRITADMAAAAHTRFREDCAQPISLLRETIVEHSELEHRFHERHKCGSDCLNRIVGRAPRLPTSDGAAGAAALQDS